MAKNSLAPGFVKLQYSTVVGSVTLDHYQRLGINPAVWSGATTTLTPKSGAATLWTTAVAAYAAVMKALFTASSTLIAAELWRQDTPASDPLYQATSALALAGTNGGATSSMTQALFQLYGADDSQFRVTLIEGYLLPNIRTNYAALGAGAPKDFFDYLLSNANCFWSRGNSYPASASFVTTKANDKIRRIRMGL